MQAIPNFNKTAYSKTRISNKLIKHLTMPPGKSISFQNYGSDYDSDAICRNGTYVGKLKVEKFPFL